PLMQLFRAGWMEGTIIVWPRMARIADCHYSKLETRNSKLGKDATATHWSRVSIFEFLFSAPAIGNQQSAIDNQPSLSAYSRTSAWWRTSTPSTRNRTSSAMLVA